jgi:hypothetical protein
MAKLTGAHSIIYSTNAALDRTFLRDVLSLPSVDAGSGWLIFGLPPAEVAIHPSDENDRHEMYLMCDDVEALVQELQAKSVTCGPITNQGWGMLTHITLPGGSRLGIYQARHARPPAPSMKTPRKASTKRKAARRKR